MNGITSKWSTVKEIAFTGNVAYRCQNPGASGGICLLQARHDSNGAILTRKVNSNGLHQEIGPTYRLLRGTAADWVEGRLGRDDLELVRSR